MMNAPPSEQLAGFVIDPDRRVLEDRRSKRTIPLHEARLVRRNVSLFQADVAVLELRSGSEKVCQVVQVDAASGTSVIEKVVAAFKGAGVA